jgi:acetyl esterase
VEVSAGGPQASLHRRAPFHRRGAGSVSHPQPTTQYIPYARSTMFATAVRHLIVTKFGRFGLLAVLLLCVATPLPAHARVADDLRVTRNLQYGADHGEALLLDAYEPAAAAAPSPILILIHGGGWVSGDKAEYEPFARALAGTGYVVFDINYSLDLSRSPAFPREVTDVRTALHWVESHAEQFKGDINRIGIAGGSAGGYLAAVVGTRADSSSKARIRAVISLSGPMDLVSLVADLRKAVTSSEPCAPAQCVAIDRAKQRLSGLLGCDPLVCPQELLREASPLTYVTAATPPFFLANSTDEILPATQATNMAAALRSVNVPVSLQLVPGTGHAVAYVSSIRTQLLNFLTKYVAGHPSDPGNSAPSRPQNVQWSAVLRWIVVITVAGLLIALLAARWWGSGGVGGRSSDPLEPSHTTEERR